MSDKAKTVRADMQKVIFNQILMIMGFVLILLVFKGLQKSISSLGGALAYFVPTCIFVLRVSMQSATRAPLQFLITFFVGEVVKLLLSGILFVLAVKYLHIDLMYALLGLFAAIIAFWVAGTSVVLRLGAKA